ncbi:MAG TPA: MerC domain-containing protein [Mucilaginibacter sp.]|jgi:hypothetical protein
MSSQKRGSKLDRIGMTAFTLCAIHCAIVPLLITSLPLLGLGFLANPWFEWGMIIFALFIGIYARLYCLYFLRSANVESILRKVETVAVFEVGSFHS